MIIKYLLGRASTGKFRFFNIETDEQWSEEKKGFIIQRSYGQVGGKTTLSPEIIVGKKPKSKTWQEQLQLKFDSEVKKQLDKGYIELTKDANEYSIEELSELFGEEVCNQAGIIKPMLAKQQDKVTNRKIFDKEWLCSKKLDGVRCLMYWDGNKVLTASRGGDDYDISTTHIRESDELVGFFKLNPTVILDGELYCHGKSLQTLSGAARLEKNATDCDFLEYWIYDCYKKDQTDLEAKYRQDFLQLIPQSDKIKVLEQISVSGEDNIWKLHNQFVQEGYEGCVVRDPERPYKPNGRTNDMIKFKQYKSEDFLVIDYELGTRGSEDMVFICQMEDGRTFKAMPVGNREVKEEYVENFESIYKDHLVECTYFNYSDEGIPTQPKARVFRFDLE